MRLPCGVRCSGRVAGDDFIRTAATEIARRPGPRGTTELRPLTATPVDVPVDLAGRKNLTAALRAGAAGKHEVLHEAPGNENSLVFSGNENSLILCNPTCF